MSDVLDWQRLSSLLDEALALEGAARTAWLQALADSDAAMAQRVARALRDTAPPAGAAFQRLLAPSSSAGAQSDLAGVRLGAWALEACIGQGGMGEVWRARRADGLYEAHAAIKLLRSDLPAEHLAGRFARERAVLARLDHPAIARLLDAGADCGRAYLVLELVHGQSLAEHVRERALPVAARVALLLQVAEAVDSAHARLIVHRDLKPSNVMVTPDGKVKLLDFGIAGLLDDADVPQHHGDLTRQGGRGLTLGYAAPEQVSGAPIGTPSDVFSLGAMLYELLGGSLPFGPRHQTRATAEHAVLHHEPRRLAELAEPAADDPHSPGRPPDFAKARGDLEAIAAKALRKNPAQRYGSARAFIADLQRWQAHEPVSARRDDWRHRSRLWLRRNALPAGAAALLVITLAGGLASSTWQWRRAQGAARQSDQVTGYLVDLLSSSLPEQHGGQWPTVLQLLERSSAELPTRFADDPETRLRLLGVLSNTYAELNRFDRALTLAADWTALAVQQHGANSHEALEATLAQARALQIFSNHGQSIALLEPIRGAVMRAFGRDSEVNRKLHYVLAANYMHTGRLDDADAELAEAWRVTELLHADGALARADHLNNLHVLRNRQGRTRDALAVVRQTVPLWASTDPQYAKQILVLRRNELDTQIDLGDYDRIEPRSQALVQDMERVLGPANELALLQHRMLARYFVHVGQPARAAGAYDQLLQRAQAGGLAAGDGVLLRPRAERLLARTRSALDAPARLLADARALKAEVLAGDAPPSPARVDALLSLAAVGLALDDIALAADCQRAVGDQATQGWTELAAKAQRVTGALARAQGDWAQSRTWLQRQASRHDHRPEQAFVLSWSAHLDLAYTQLLMGDPQAAATLAAAAQKRPRSVPAGHALDAAAAYLQARLTHGTDHAPEVQAALRDLVRATGRGAWPGASADPTLEALRLKSTLGGVFL